MPSIADLERMLTTSPGDPFVLYGLAQEHARQGRHDQAIEFYDQCLRADPAYCYAYFHKAKTLEAAGRVPEAIATLQAGITAARNARDQHALSEVQGYLDELSP